MFCLPFVSGMVPLHRVAAALATLCAAAQAVAPKNPYLADSSWPTAHCNSYADDWTDRSVPESGDHLVADVVGTGGLSVDQNSLNAITLVASNDNRWIWGTSISSVMLYRADGGALTLVDIYHNGLDLQYHGAYSFVSVDGVYYSSTEKGFNAYKVDAHDKIQRVGAFEAPGFLDGEVVVGVQMMFDGNISFATAAGRVGMVKENPEPLTTEHFLLASEIVDLRLENEPAASFISNSISVDEDLGIYLVSLTALYRVQWNPSTGELSLDWRQQYSQGDPLHPGRLGRGIGSTPSIMVQEDGKKHVVVSDGLLPMNVLAVEADTGRVVGNKTVNFVPGQLAQSEQSTVVSDQRVAVVQNNFPDWKKPLWCRLLPSGIGKLKNACPYMMGIQPWYGVAQYRVAPTGEVTHTWTNPDIQCSSSIPAVASQGGGKTFLCVGQRPRTWWALFGWLLPDTVFTVESLDWDSGESVWWKEIGTGSWFNPMYSGVQVGSENDIYFGTLGGVVRVVDQAKSSSHYSLCRKHPAWQFMCAFSITHVLWSSLFFGAWIVYLVVTCCCSREAPRPLSASTELTRPMAEAKP